jgi:hypothetical protein
MIDLIFTGWLTYALSSFEGTRGDALRFFDNSVVGESLEKRVE